MKIVKLLPLSVLLAGSFAAPAFAINESDSRDMFFRFMQTGFMQIQMKSNPMIDEVIKGGMLIDDKSIIVMHNGKTYLVKDMKMSNGKMLTDYIENHNDGK
jgi:hypothetical protein